MVTMDMETEDATLELYRSGVKDLRQLDDRVLNTPHIRWLRPLPKRDLEEVLPLEIREKGSRVVTNLTSRWHHAGKTTWSKVLARMPHVSPKSLVVTKDRASREYESTEFDEVVSPKVFDELLEEDLLLFAWQRVYEDGSRPTYRMGLRISVVRDAIDSVDGKAVQVCLSFLNVLALARLDWILSPGFIPSFWLDATRNDRRAMDAMRSLNDQHEARRTQKRDSVDPGPLGVSLPARISGRVILQNRLMWSINGIPIGRLTEEERMQVVVPWLEQGLHAPLLHLERSGFLRSYVAYREKNPHCTLDIPQITRYELVQGIMFRAYNLGSDSHAESEDVARRKASSQLRQRCLHYPAIPRDWVDPTFRLE